MGPAHRRGVGRFFSVEKLIAEYPRQLEYDLRAHCGVRLKDLWRDGGDLTYREVSVLFDGLPGECLTKTAIRDKLTDEQLADLARKRDGHGQWSHTDLRLAAIEDLLGIIARGQRIVDDFKPVDRPGISRGRRRGGNPIVAAAVRAIAEEHARLHGYDLEA